MTISLVTLRNIRKYNKNITSLLNRHGEIAGVTPGKALILIYKNAGSCSSF